MCYTTDVSESEEAAMSVEDWLEPDPCAACGGDLVLLGSLGSRVHFRCRHCGLDQSLKGEAT